MAVVLPTHPSFNSCQIKNVLEKKNTPPNIKKIKITVNGSCTQNTPPPLIAVKLKIFGRTNYAPEYQKVKFNKQRSLFDFSGCFCGDKESIYKNV